jgi:hypothetical protein
MHSCVAGETLEARSDVDDPLHFSVVVDQIGEEL